jgi:hypothetical protein
MRAFVSSVCMMYLRVFACVYWMCTLPLACKSVEPFQARARVRVCTCMFKVHFGTLCMREFIFPVCMCICTCV